MYRANFPLSRYAVGMSDYHHGDLPRQLLTHAASMAATEDPESISLRELARRTGVSHSAPVHHFGSRRGLLTALAIAGFENLNVALEAHEGDLNEMGVTYVTWALSNPGHYAVMWRPRLLDHASEALVQARNRSWNLLSGAVFAETGSTQSAKIDAYAAFSIVHGLASLWLNSALPLPENPAERIRDITSRIVPGQSSRTSRR